MCVCLDVSASAIYEIEACCRCSKNEFCSFILAVVTDFLLASLKFNGNLLEIVFGTVLTAVWSNSHEQYELIS